MAQKLAAKPNFDRFMIFVHMKKTMLYFNNPVYLGMSIFDLSKSLVYDFRYNYIKTKYGDNAKLLFTDTDSLAYEIITKDIEKLFDISDFPTSHPSGIKTGLIILKCLQFLRMKLVGSRLLNLLV